MESSMTLLSAHIQFLETQLALIHIPLHLYSAFLQPLLQLILPSDLPDSTATGAHGTAGSNHSSPSSSSSYASGSWTHTQPFVNISVTPIECSIACSRSLATDLFVPIRDGLDRASRDQVSITTEDFVVMQVDGEGLDAGQRVLELTSPLALAGISIFFITTYFSDYILVPLRSRAQVVQALEERGFAFEHQTSSYVNPSHHRHHSSTSSVEHGNPPGTPPPATISELQTRTFATLKRRNIVPTVDPTIRLVQCAGRKEVGRSSNGLGSPTTSADDALLLGLVRCFLTPRPRHPPRFLSLTLTDTEPASLLLDARLLAHFADDVLLGTWADRLVPITLDLRELPLESTGIVCGVAGRLVGGTSTTAAAAAVDPLVGAAAAAAAASVEMSYLSTARAGTVMVSEDELQRALDALKGAEEKGFEVVQE